MIISFIFPHENIFQVNATNFNEMLISETGLSDLFYLLSLSLSSVTLSMKCRYATSFNLNVKLEFVYLKILK